MSSRRWSARCGSGSSRPGGPGCARDPSCSRGVALVTVTWLLALMTLLAGAALTIARTSSRLAANRVAVAQAELLADSAIRRALLSLLETDARQRWPVTGQPIAFHHRGDIISVRISDESGRIDINGAEAGLLSAAFAASGISEPQARSLAARMIDWRDADDEPLPLGAERTEYLARATGYGPRNAPFESVDEMWLVAGMPRELRTRVAPLFTVYTGQSAVNEAAASVAVRGVLEWAERHDWDGRQWLSGPVASSESGRSTAGRVFRINAAVAGVSELATLDREAVVRITGDLRRPMLVYSWSTAPTRALPDAQ